MLSVIGSFQMKPARSRWVCSKLSRCGLLRDHADAVLRVAAALVERRTILGAEIERHRGSSLNLTAV
jgi:hypothetical protein